MSRHVTSRHWGGWFLGAIVAGAMVPLTIQAIQSRHFSGAVPAILLGLYVAAVLGVNRSNAEVDEQGVVVRYGPLPTGERELRVPRNEITAVYVRKGKLSGRPPRVYWQAGVATRAGYWVDIGSPDNAEAEARAVVQALTWKNGIDRCEGRVPKMQGRGLRIGLRLAALAGGCWWWATRF